MKPLQSSYQLGSWIAEVSWEDSAEAYYLKKASKSGASSTFSNQDSICAALALRNFSVAQGGGDRLAAGLN